MCRNPFPILTVLFIIIFLSHTVQLVGQVPSSVLVDDEYDRYRKRADDSFREGDYHQALRQYHNCLAVPGFEADPYAQKRISESTTCMSLSLQAETALTQNKGPEAISLFDKLLAINLEDSQTKNKIVSYYERKGDGLFDDKKYVDARTVYGKAISYAAGQKKIDLSNKLTNVNKLRATSQRLKLQMTAGVMAVGATIYALTLRSDYLTKRNTLDQISYSAQNPVLPGTIDNAETYSKYKEAYAAAQAAEKKQVFYIASVSVAAIATLAEVYLFRNSSKKNDKKMTWKPSSQSLGLAVTYSF